MSAVNSVNVIGRLGQEPQLRYTPQGTPVVNMNLAINEQFGENERTTWIRIVAWKGTAEACNQYLDKGSLVAVNGRLQSRSYEKDGHTVYVTEIVANNVKFLDGRRNDSGSSPEEELPEPALDEEEIPF